MAPKPTVGAKNHGAALPPTVPHALQHPGNLRVLLHEILSCNKQVLMPKLSHAWTRRDKGSAEPLCPPQLLPKFGTGGSSSCWDHLTFQQQIFFLLA